MDASERHLVELLLNYGQRPIEVECLAENGETQYGSYTLAELVVNDLQSEELSFADPLCQKIFRYYCDSFARGEEPDATSFITADDEALRSFAISLMLDTYRISESWRRKQVFVPTLEDHLREDLTETMLSFKLKCIDERIAENGRRLREARGEEEVDRLLLEKKGLVEVRRKIGGVLHRVIN